jgi:hypothetical protein
MEKPSKHKSIYYISDIRKIDSNIDLKEAIYVEEKLGEESRKGQIMWVIVISSVLIIGAVLGLLYLKSYGHSGLDTKTILVLSSGTVCAIVGFMGTIVKYYWNKQHSK